MGRRRIKEDERWRRLKKKRGEERGRGGGEKGKGGGKEERKREKEVETRRGGE